MKLKIIPVLLIYAKSFLSFVSIQNSINTFYQGRLSFKQCLPLKSSKFGKKRFELYDSKTGCLWSFIAYTGKDTDIHSSLIMGNVNKTAKIVLNVSQPLLGQTYLNYHTDCIRTLKLNRKNFSQRMKEKKLKKGEVFGEHSGPISVLKWSDKRKLSMMSMYHGAEMKTGAK
ncbi:hypothetical protein J437_LFUL017936 [Ladona fulva]|uniref:PiggyBac transposable element-derived protein domain-containing protein n=1 Tax=Ladona fulva TaxID=123851 RepID=A0A8K0KPU2_LADFU|nr:hypothetical protein J437_LFUL017936 [Ladona fulva]